MFMYHLINGVIVTGEKSCLKKDAVPSVFTFECKSPLAVAHRHSQCDRQHQPSSCESSSAVGPDSLNLVPDVETEVTSVILDEHAK